MRDREQEVFNDIFVSEGRGNRMLLVVDSDPQNLLYVQMLLQGFEFRTNTARSAREAYALASTIIPSLILTAVDLKDMSGLNLMKSLRKSAKTTNIPFIVMRRQEEAVTSEMCFKAGAVDCLIKPISAELLYRAVQGATEDRPRAYMRIRTIQPVKVDTAPYDGRDGIYTLDLSERGIYLRTTKPAPENTRLHLQINLNGIIVPVETNVVYTCPPCKGPYSEPGMGLQFTQILPNDLELIRRFIKHEVVRGIVPEKDRTYSPTDHAS
jgi:CheY-like chemotaxis protein